MRHRLLPVALTSLALLLLVAPARAGDDDLPGWNDVAGFVVADVALAEAALPADGSLKAAAAPSEEARVIEGFLKATASHRGSDADTLSRGFTTADGKPVTLVLADAGQFEDVSKEVTEGAAKKGWSARTLGHHARIAVVAGPDGVREKVLDLQTAFAVKLLGEKLKKRLDGTGEESIAIANSILKMEPKHALSNFAAGVAYAGAGQRDQDAALTAQSIARYKAALAPDAVSPLTGDWLLRAKGSYGQTLLSSVNGKPSAEARDILVAVVKALPGSKLTPQTVIGFRYDLACAHSRLGEKDAAFEQLTAALEANVKTPVEGISHWRDKDPDLDPLKSDPRWAPLVEKYPPPKGEEEGHGGGGMEEPGMGEPGMDDPGMGEPGMGEPGMGEPGMGEPGMEGGK